jgi:hypothetical protein
MFKAVIWWVLTQSIGDVLSVWRGTTNTKKFNFHYFRVSCFLFYIILHYCSKVKFLLKWYICNIMEWWWHIELQLHFCIITLKMAGLLAEMCWWTYYPPIPQKRKKYMFVVVYTFCKCVAWFNHCFTGHLNIKMWRVCYKIVWWNYHCHCTWCV